MKKIVVDAGHGGEDQGASGNGIIEKDLTLKISKYMKDRFDELKVYKNENLLIIHNENYTKDTVRIVNNKLFTSKKDTISHGYGTESIKETVKKYKGVCTFSCANNIFSVDILIPLENKKQ